MKKIISIIILSCLMVGLCACGDSSSHSGKKYEEINLGATIQTEFADISFDDIKISNKINNKNLNVDLQDESDKVYFTVQGRVSNKGTDALSLWGLYVKVLIDDTYIYDTVIELEEKEPLVPLDSEAFIAHASLPDEVFNSCKNYSVKIGFNNNFHTIETDIEKCEFMFEINGTVDEFGSAESVEDFQSLTEYVNTLTDNSVNNNLKVEANASNENIKIYSNVVIEVIHNDETFTFVPKLTIYNPITSGAVYPVFYFNITTNGDSSTHYMYVDNLQLESNNGVYVHNQIVPAFGDTGTWGKNTWGRYTTCNITESDTLEQLLTVLNGENLTISFDAVPTQGQNEHIQFECTDKVKESMINLCNIFKDIVDNEFYIQ